MSEFFKPWRRKLGVVTLAVACVFAGGWVRSLGVSDRRSHRIGNTTYFIISSHGFASWCAVTSGSPSDIPLRWQTKSERKTKWLPSELWGTAKADWRCQALGFDFARGGYDASPHSETILVGVIPYWSMVSSP